MIYLQSDRLRVEVCEPHEEPNTSYRFDRAGFVSEVTLDGRMRFCASEPNNLWHPCSGGRGLCSEFVFDVSEQAELGELFPKLGIGLFKKTDNEPYRYYKTYEAELFPVSFEATPSSAVFKTSAVPCLGYAAEHVKRIEVLGNQLVLSMRLTNVGEKPFDVKEFCHNFFSIGGMAIGRGYTIDFPCINGIPQGEFESSDGLDNYLGTATGIQIRGYAPKFATLRFKPAQFSHETPFCWSLRNSAAKAKVRCEESFVPAGITVWCVDHIVSPEVFHAISLQSGETETWTRTYTFE